ncbi:MAG: (Fe-S)-binding protein [Deltaproteobacteria bacterium]|nr:(Fe-S)-binding protein [Deltaproteobacteria bacterium]
MLSAMIFTLAIVVAGGLFARTLYGRFRLLAAARPVARFDRIPERIGALLLYGFGQKKFVVDEQPAGWLHFFIFWGFLILVVQVVTMFGRGYSEHFFVPGLSPEQFGGPLLLVRDLMEATVFVCVVAALVRWTFTHPERLFGFRPAEDRLAEQSHIEARVILFFIMTIVLGGLVYDGGRLVYFSGEPEIEAGRFWEPVSRVVGSGLQAAFGVAGAKFASDTAWWAHNLVILAFLNVLPLSKHFHVITGLPNVFFKKTEPTGALDKMDLENSERFGISQIDQFTWKQVLDMFSCTECGRCSSECPATASGKPLAPRQLLLNLRDHLYEHPEQMLTKSGGEGEGAVKQNIVGSVIQDDVLWSCTTCRACEEACPVMIEYVDKIVDMRRHLVQEEARFPPELTRTFKGMETQGNPWGLSADKRMDWAEAEGLEIPLFADNPDAEYLYYVGCAGAFDDRNKKTTASFARLLQKAGLSFAVLGPEESCNGETARRLGNEYLYQSMAQMAVDTLNGYNVKKVIVNCPHCFNTMKNEFPQFGGNYEVVHAADLLSDLLKRGKIELKPEVNKRNVTYHDSCYYGRYNGIYEKPREILERIPGTHLQEMERNRTKAMCCGAGGGWMWMEEPRDQRVNHLRVGQALETEPDVIAVSCPFCTTMFNDGLKAKDADERVQLMNVVELVEQAAK